MTETKEIEAPAGAPAAPPTEALRQELSELAKRGVAQIQEAGLEGPKLMGMVVIGACDDGSLPIAIIGLDPAGTMQVLQGVAPVVEEAMLEQRLGMLRAGRGAA